MRYMNRVWIGTVCLLGLMTAGWVVSAGIPTVEERIATSSMNPGNLAWTAKTIRLWPPPARTNLPVPQVCYRYDFDLPARPRSASASVTVSGLLIPYTLKVNGKTLVEPMPGRMGAFRNLDLTEVLRAGHNVLTFRNRDEKRKLDARLLLQGIVFCEDGSTVRLTTDENWRAGWDLAGDWDSPDARPTDLVPARAFPLTVDDRLDNPMFQPYHGAIRVEPVRGKTGRAVGQGRSIFDEEDPVALAITIVNGVFRRVPPPDPQPSTLSYTIMDEVTRAAVGQGNVALRPSGKLDLAGTVTVGPLPAGAYRFRFVLDGHGGDPDRFDYEVACVGETRQTLVDGASYTDGMDLKEVLTIDCTVEPKPGEFTSLNHRGEESKTVVREGPAGKYRTFVDEVHYQNFAYRFKVKTLYVPHLAVIEWPDDADRGLLVQIYEGTSMFHSRYKVAQPGFRGGFQRGETSIVCTDEHPRRTNKMQKLYIIYWPNEEVESVHIWNTTGGKEPAGVSRVTIYEITNDLPALRIKDAGDRMIGYHTERGPSTMSASYYAGPLGAFFTYAMAGVEHPEYYRNWYTTTENMVKRMRFSGQNMYLMGHFMYTGVLYPSKRYIFAQNSYHGGDANGDYCALILRMFQRNGLSMVSGIEYVNTPDVMAEASAVSLEDVVQKGAETLFTMNKDASLSALHGGSAWKGLNYFHPRVQESMLTIVEELVDLYKDYPAWKGVSFILSRNFGPMTVANAKRDNALNYGYEDYTVALFEKETGIRVPVEPLDPKRFRKRHAWLLTNAKQEWIDWRCAQYTALFCKFRDRLVRGRPDLKLYLVNFEPMNFTDEAAQMVGHCEDADFANEVVKLFGFDVKALKKQKGIVVSFSYPSPGTGVSVGAKQRVYRDLTHSQPWHDLFANDGKGGAYIWSGIPHYGPRYPKDAWYFEWPVVRQGFFWPRFFSDTFVKALVRSNPTWMPHTWMDVAESGGRLHDLRLFSRIYRSLPNGKYERLTGNGLDKNLWVETTRAKGAIYGYAANAHWWDVDVSLEFAKGVRVHSLVEDQPVGLNDNRWSFTLGPYGVKPFRIDRGMLSMGSPIRAAETAIHDGPDKQLGEALGEARDVLSRAQARAADINGMPGWEAVPVLASMIGKIEARQRAGDVSKAYELAASWELEKAGLRVVNEAMEAMPFIVLGPFGDETSTAAPPKSYYEVVPEYKGLETPYLQEFEGIAGAKLPALTAGFCPDVSRTYDVYPGKKAKWTAAAKTDFLSFDGVCASPHPVWAVAYAYAEIHSPEARDVAIWAGSDHSLAIWCNDRFVLKHGGHGSPRGGQRPSGARQNKGGARLVKGWNRILVKAVQRSGARVFFRITDRAGKGVDDLKFRVPTAG